MLAWARWRNLRFAAFLLTAVCLSAAQGQGFPGAKPDPAGASSLSQGAGGGMGALFNVLLALGIVYGLLRYAMPNVLSRMNKRLVTGAGSAIKVEESASFAGGSLYVVSARGKTILLAVGSQGVRFLTDLTETPTAPEPPSFGDLVERELLSKNEERKTINDQGRTMDDERSFGSAQDRLPTNDKGHTTNDERRTTNDERRTIGDLAIVASDEKEAAEMPATDGEWSAALARLERLSK